MTNLNTIVALEATLEAIEDAGELHLHTLDVSDGGLIMSSCLKKGGW
jgi:hypothetical protein